MWYELTLYVLFTYKLSLKRLSIGRPWKKADDVSFVIVSLSNLRRFITWVLPALFLIDTNVTINHTSHLPVMRAACPAEF